MDPETECRMEAVARRQSGHLTRDQLAAAGMSRSTLYRWAHRGRLVAVGRRTYRLASVVPSVRGDVLAVCLDLGAVASHRTASWLHGLGERPSVIDVTVARGTPRHVTSVAGSRWPVRVHSSTNLPADDVLVVAGLPITSVARTILGLAALVPREVSDGRLVEVVSVAIERDLAALPWLWWLLEHRRCKGRNGVTAMEAALAECNRLGPTESWLERELLRILEAAGLPLPTTQRVVRREGHFVARVDFAYEGTPVLLEALGYRYHRTAAQLDADARRANELQLLGYDVYQFTARQIAERAAWVVEVTEAAFRRAHPVAASNQRTDDGSPRSG